ncbi:transcription factor atoh8 isoform X2 [Latimeria chalumnae]|uniref:transcription factor atoh8 isoform X2 n=1 Tax=Latimeria chalumnae TaxID=7897 RepID=UPI0003C11476|nr:PREDICTED: protein atonal homolog 8 isoform X2 [Latimeria chalumnae]|eukprot:XP_014348269.1 PREDICTED: protein atonal homolog 8 isoform X2 [Latimeria chalumnae]
MKNQQVLAKEEWKKLCGNQINGIKRLKRKNKEVFKHVNGFKGFKADLKANEHLFSGEAAGHESSQDGATTSNGTAADLIEIMRSGGAGDVIDMRNAALPTVATVSSHSLAPNEDKYSRSAHVNGLEPQSFPADPGLQSRILLCQRPSENSYSSVSHVPYSNTDPTTSPRKRLGETAGVPSEIKAIQQTRRLLANARERTRVHTISAAFEALRKQVPCYSYGQKLSKLAILRIACNYILSLARLADQDYTADHSNMSFSECVEQCTRTLQAEGRSKKRKVDQTAKVRTMTLYKKLMYCT